jgi:hypothetical protein
MDLVEIEKARQPLAAREGRRSNQTPWVDSTRMQLDTESRMGISPIFSQSVGKYRKGERCRTCGRTKRLQVQENKGQEIGDGRSPHQALDALTGGIQRKRANWVLDADIRGFFDNLSHEWTMKFIALARPGRPARRACRQSWP